MNPKEYKEILEIHYETFKKKVNEDVKILISNALDSLIEGTNYDSIEIISDNSIKIVRRGVEYRGFINPDTSCTEFYTDISKRSAVIEKQFKNDVWVELSDLLRELRCSYQISPDEMSTTRERIIIKLSK